MQQYNAEDAAAIARLREPDVRATYDLALGNMRHADGTLHAMRERQWLIDLMTNPMAHQQDARGYGRYLMLRLKPGLTLAEALTRIDPAWSPSQPIHTAHLIDTILAFGSNDSRLDTPVESEKGLVLGAYEP